MVLENILKNIGVSSFTSVGDGDQALEILLDSLNRGNSQIKLAFLDFHMPGKSGFEIAEGIRQWEKENGRVPMTLVLCSGDDIQRNDNFDSHLMKPLLAEKVKEIVLNAGIEEKG